MAISRRTLMTTAAATAALGASRALGQTAPASEATEFTYELDPP